MTEGTSYTVTAGNGSCTSTASSSFSIAAQLTTPATPIASVTVQPTCAAPTGTIVVTSPVGVDIEYSVNATTYQIGTTFNGLVPNTYNLTARSISTGCVSNSLPLVVNVVPGAPATPVAIITTQPTCGNPSADIQITSPVGPTILYSFNGVDYQASPIFTNVPAGVTYTVTAQDNTSLCTLSPPLTFTLNLAPNCAPVLDDEFVTINEDGGPATGDLTDVGDSDPEGGSLTANTTPINPPNNGTITINADGTFSYTPNINFNGIDTVVISICDNGNPAPVQCANDTIFITVNPVNDPPVLDNEFHTINEDGTATGDLTNAGDSDVDGTLVVNITPVSGPTNGNITINPDGTYTYTPNGNFNGTDQVVVQICDDGSPLPAICVNDTIFITINPVNDPPIVDNEIHTEIPGNPITGDLTDSGDSDPDGTNLTVTVLPIVPPSHGTITIDPTGTYTYTPNPGYTGQDTIVVQVCDQGLPLPGICVNDTIFITILPCPSPTDTDNDGLTDCEETTGVNDPNTPATPTGTTDPNDPCDPIGLLTADTDGDGLTDCEETTGVNDPNTPATPTGTTDPNDPCDPIGLLTADTDGDGLTDCEETTGVNDPNTPATPTGTTDPNDPCDPIGLLTADTDGDGLTDCEETTGVNDPNTPATPTGSTDPNDPCDPIGLLTADTDGDGLTDCEETTGVNDPNTPATPTGTTDPNDPCDPIGLLTVDTDGDGLTDCEETTGIDDPNTPATPTGTTDPNDPCDPIGLLTADTDGDGLTDCEETTGVNDPNTPATPTGTTDPNDPCDPIGLLTVDTDGDGLTDCEETTGIDDPNTPITPTGQSDPNDPCDPIPCDLVIPNAFTPDGDGMNDELVIQGIENYPNNTITIYNRWGNVVFQTSGYQNDWTGTSTMGITVGGDELPTGTYYYILDLQVEGKEIYKGFIYLQR
jgi:gliding motility-associated-like protein